MKKFFSIQNLAWIIFPTIFISACGTEQSANPRSIDVPIVGTTVPTNQGAINFGGMYSTGSYGTAFNNPLAGNTAGCPSGFSAAQILGNTSSSASPISEQNVYLCWASFSSVPTAIAAFGGIYGSGSTYANSSVTYNNPITNAQSCPSGYSSQQIMDAANASLTYCYVNLQSGGSVSVNYAFGGLFGFHSSNSQQTAYANPSTNAASCPIGFTQNVVYGSYGKHFPLLSCLAAENSAAALTASSGDGLLAQFYNFPVPSPSASPNPYGGQPVFTRIDTTPSFSGSQTGDVSPAAGVNSTYWSVKWTGRLVPQTSDTYTFTAQVDDGIQIKIDGQPMFSQAAYVGALAPNSITSNSISLNAGQSYQIEIDYFQVTGPTYLNLTWAGKTVASSALPQSVLYSD